MVLLELKAVGLEYIKRSNNLNILNILNNL